MTARQLSASRFKAECLALLDEIAATGETLVITKRGRPVAQVTPTGSPPSLTGSVTVCVDDDELIAPLGVAWDAAAR
jgi:prevent-host-death family protein